MAKRFGRYVPAQNGTKFSMFSNPVNKEDNQRRSLYDALVDKGPPEYTKAPDTQPYYDPERDAYIQAWPIDLGYVPWDTTDQWRRMIDIRDQWGPSSYIKKEFNSHTPGKISGDVYFNLRNDISRISQARAAASHMGWQLTPEQLAFLASKGK